MTIVAGSLASAADVNAALATKVSVSGGDSSATTVTATGGTTSRTLADRAKELVNVKDYGAALNGSTNDNAAFNNARIAAGLNGTAFVPQGGWVISVAPTGGSSGPILWKLSANCFGSGTTPVTGIGTDSVESVVAGGKYFGRSGTSANIGPLVRFDNVVNHSGGTTGNVIPTLKINSSIPANASALNNFVWGISSLVTSAATGPGQHVAVVGQSTRSANGSGVMGGNFYAADTTGNASSTSGALVGAEIDCNGDDIDDGGVGTTTFVPNFQGIRVGIDISLSRVGTAGAPATAHIGWGSRISGGNGASDVVVDRGYAVAMRIGKAGFTTEYSTLETGADAFRMASGQTFALDAARATTFSSDGAIITATGKLQASAGLSAFGVTPPSSRPAITGSRGSATAAVLASLLTALAATGIITDSTTA